MKKSRIPVNFNGFSKDLLEQMDLTDAQNRKLSAYSIDIRWLWKTVQPDMTAEKVIFENGVACVILFDS